jgi:hypothetical protein
VRIKVVLVAIILIFQVGKTNAQDFQLAGLSFAAYPRTSVNDVSQEVEFSFLEYGAFINIPVQLKNEKTIIINGLEYGLVQNTGYGLPGSGSNESKDLLHLIKYNFKLFHKLNDKWDLLLMLSPTLASDFENKLVGDDFVLQAAAVGIINLNNHFSLGGGLSYTMRFGELLFIPLFSLNYKKAKHSIDALIPIKVVYNYAIGSKERFKIGLKYLINGAQFNTSNTDEYNAPEIDKIIYSRINVGGNIQYSLFKNIQLMAFFGGSFRRHYRLIDVSNNSYNSDLKNVPFIQVGITFTPPNIKYSSEQD